jgi:formylglycine-generating enzyme required for sulfatase activity
MKKHLGVLLFAAMFWLGAGCRDRNADKPDVKVESLPVIQSKSGGELVLVPAGAFTMGDAAGRDDETPHTVAVSAFYIDKHPVTQELYAKVMNANPSKHKDPKCPVERVQWVEAVRFCNQCSELDGLSPCYNLDTWECNFVADGYRLPTEAEWEYACRAGGSTRYSAGDDEKALLSVAWFKANSKGNTKPVGQKSANRFGLFDMHGNVWQWCHDWYGETYYKDSPKDDPRGPASGTKRVLRGGAWDMPADKCRSAHRHKDNPANADACFGADPYGFRRVRSKSEPEALAKLKTQKPFANASGSEKKPITPAAKGKIDPAALKGTIIFVKHIEGGTRIWAMHASGKNPRQLTKSKGNDADPRFSPDGKRILYTTLIDGFPEVWVMNRDGSEPKLVTRGREAGWSPDAKEIVFIRDNQTYVRNLDTGKEHLVTPKNWERCGVPAFSPDGKKIAVASRHLAKIGIFLVDLTGKELGQLKTEEACCTPCWSKDGKRILCQSDKGTIHEVLLDGKGDEQVTFGADVQHDARYSPDGTMILFCRAPNPDGPWRICVQRVDAELGEFIELTKAGSSLSPDWHAEE